MIAVDMCHVLEDAGSSKRDGDSFFFFNDRATPEIYTE